MTTIIGSSSGRIFEDDNSASRITIYEGNIATTLERIFANGESPLTVPFIMCARLEALNTAYKGDNLNFDIWRIPVTSADGAMRHPDGRLKFAYNTERLRRVKASDLFYQGALDSTAQYDTETGPEFSAAEVKRYARRDETSVQSLMRNPLYVEGLAHGNQMFAREYAKAHFAMVRKHEPRATTFAMHPLSSARHAVVERLWQLGSLEKAALNGANSLTGMKYATGAVPRMLVKTA